MRMTFHREPPQCEPHPPATSYGTFAHYTLALARAHYAHAQEAEALALAPAYAVDSVYKACARLPWMARYEAELGIRQRAVEVGRRAEVAYLDLNPAGAGNRGAVPVSCAGGMGA